MAGRNYKHTNMSMFRGVPQEVINAQKYKIRGKIDRKTKKIWSEIKYIMGAKQNLKMAVGRAVISIKAIENLVTQFTPLKIQGLYQICNDLDS
jgi:hypothetical protein